MSHEILLAANTLITTLDLKCMEAEGYEAVVGYEDTLLWRKDK